MKTWKKLLALLLALAMVFALAACGDDDDDDDRPRRKDKEKVEDVADAEANDETPAKADDEVDVEPLEKDDDLPAAFPSSALSAGDAGEAITSAVMTFFDGDAKKVFDCMPPVILEKTLELSEISYDEMIAQAQEGLEDAVAQLADEYGEDFKVTVTPTSVEAIDDETTSSYRALYAMFDETLNIEQFAKVDATMTIRGSRGEDSDETSIMAVCIDGKWYMDFFSLGGMMGL